MWTRSKSADGKFECSLYSITGEHVETRYGFTTPQAADRAAEAAQRIDLFGDKAALTLDQIIDSASDDELLAELLA